MLETGPGQGGHTQADRPGQARTVGTLSGVGVGGGGAGRAFVSPQGQGGGWASFPHTPGVVGVVVPVVQMGALRPGLPLFLLLTVTGGRFRPSVTPLPPQLPPSPSPAAPRRNPPSNGALAFSGRKLQAGPFADLKNFILFFFKKVL